MASKPQRQKEEAGTRSTLDAAIRDLTHAKDACGVPPAQVAFDSVSNLLVVTGGSVVDKQDYIELALFCVDICQALDRGLSGRRLELDELGKSVLVAIEKLTTTVAGIQNRIVKQDKRNAVSRAFYAKSDKDTVATWRRELDRILHVFNTELAINTHTMVVDIHQNVLASREGGHRQFHPVQASIFLGELPPPAPRTCFGRDNLIKKIIGFAENLEPVALIGAGGIGKTSIALTVLHHNRIKDRFGDNRRFIRCDQFPASCTHFLAKLSKVIGAGVENPEDLTPLRPILSCQEMLIILDNAETILDPQGANAQEIYAIVDELSQFDTVCLCITSRITTVPRHCKRPAIPTLSTEAARDIFYGIYCSDGGQSGIIDDLLRCLDFHALSITLLATTASHNLWDHERLAKEWETHRAQVLRTDHNESLAATIELSLASPTFRKLGPGARDLLGVVAFFPQGIDENNLDWLFPTISDRRNVFDKFCVLSLTHRNNGFITMLAPIRDYLRPQDPESSPLLCATKDHYFTRLLVRVGPGQPGFEEARWIRSEDINVEHLLNVFTSIKTNVGDVWNVCARFMVHLYWHKPRPTVLREKIESLPDDHRSKPECTLALSRLFQSVGNPTEQKRLLSHLLKYEREQGNDSWVAQVLRWLSDASRELGLYEEGIQRVTEALEISERLGNTLEQASCLMSLALLLYEDEQLDAAEEAGSRAIHFLAKEGEEFLVCQSHRVLGYIYHSKGERSKAIYHFEVALGIASPLSWHNQLFWIHCALAEMVLDEDKFGEAQAHIEQAKSHTEGDAYCLGWAMKTQALISYRRGRLEDAASEALQVLETFEKLGASERAVEECRELLREIEGAVEG